MATQSSQCGESAPSVAAAPHVQLVATRSSELKRNAARQGAAALRARSNQLETRGDAAVSPEVFSFREARRILGDLFVHRSAIYWVDMALTLAVGYGFAYLYLNTAAFSL